VTGTSPGTCFGFAVRSSLPFHYLRGGAGSPLAVSTTSTVDDDDDGGEVLFDWTPSPRFPLAGRLVRAAPGFRLWVDTWGWFLIDPDAPRVSVPETANVVRREERLWSIPAMLCFRARGDAALHAAAVEVDGQAVVLGAPGSFGKTTLAAAFHAAGHRLLSEDTTCIRGANAPLVVPGPAMLRLRHDVAEQLEIPNAAQVGTVPDDRIHLALDPAARGDCSPVPLRAIVLLRHADQGFRITRAAAAQAVQDLWALSFRLPTGADRLRCFEAMVHLTRTVPVWDLHRPLTMRDLPATVDFVVANV
jgi:hypothetical protein